MVFNQKRFLHKKLPSEFEGNEKLMSQVPVSSTLRKSIIVSYQHIVLTYLKMNF